MLPEGLIQRQAASCEAVIFFFIFREVTYNVVVEHILGVQKCQDQTQGVGGWDEGPWVFGELLPTRADDLGVNDPINV